MSSEENLTFDEKYWKEDTLAPQTGQIKRGVCVPTDEALGAFDILRIADSPGGPPFELADCSINFNGKTYIKDTDIKMYNGEADSREGLVYLAMKSHQRTNCFYEEKSDFCAGGQGGCGTVGGLIRKNWQNKNLYKGETPNYSQDIGKMEQWSREHYRYYLAQNNFSGNTRPSKMYVTVVPDKAMGYPDPKGKTQYMFCYYSCKNIDNNSQKYLFASDFRDEGYYKYVLRTTKQNPVIKPNENRCKPDAQNVLSINGDTTKNNNPFLNKYEFAYALCNQETQGVDDVYLLTYTMKHNRPYMRFPPVLVNCSECYTFCLDLSYQPEKHPQICLVPMKSPYCRLDPILAKTPTECFPVNIDTDKSGVPDLFKQRKDKCDDLQNGGLSDSEKDTLYYKVCDYYKDSDITECKCTNADNDPFFRKLQDLQLFLTSRKYCYWKHCQQTKPLQFTRPEEMGECGGQQICINTIWAKDFTESELNNIAQNCNTNPDGGGTGGGGSGGGDVFGSIPDAAGVVSEEIGSAFKNVKEFFSDSKNVSAVLFLLAALVLLLLLLRILMLKQRGKLPLPTTNTAPDGTSAIPKTTPQSTTTNRPESMPVESIPKKKEKQVQI